MNTWTVLHGEAEFSFCSRRCMVAKLAPELTKAVVVNQWIPTPEEEERMSQ